MTPFLSRLAIATGLAPAGMDLQTQQRLQHIGNELGAIADTLSTGLAALEQGLARLDEALQRQSERQEAFSNEMQDGFNRMSLILQDRDGIQSLTDAQHDI